MNFECASLNITLTCNTILCMISEVKPKILPISSAVYKKETGPPPPPNERDNRVGLT